jgi:hypothetical protein
MAELSDDFQAAFSALTALYLDALATMSHNGIDLKAIVVLVPHENGLPASSTVRDDGKFETEVQMMSSVSKALVPELLESLAKRARQAAPSEYQAVPTSRIREPSLDPKQRPN